MTEIVLPGATHGRPAQVVTLGHHLLAHAWALSRDLERFAAWSDRTSTSALGAGALATSTLDLDPRATAGRLGFERAFANSIDAVSDRDFVQEFLGVATILGTLMSFAIVPIGYPMGRFGPVSRGPLADVVYLDRWGQRYL